MSHLLLCESLLRQPSQVSIDGFSLTPQQVIACARNKVPVALSDDPALYARVNKSVDYLAKKLGTSIYGVSTGFGGSADTRTENAQALQISLIEHQLCGVIPTSFDDLDLGKGLENTLPEEVVRGAMLIRVNSLSRGHSAVRLVVLQALIACLNKDIVPVIPLRGSISASGDLSPLSYIAATIMGHPDIWVFTTINGKREIRRSFEALKANGVTPVVLGPKEGLGLVNGTAVSASLATLTLYQTHLLTLLSQTLTAMTTESLLGHTGSFHTFIHDTCRPHQGQIEVAKNIRNILHQSKMAVPLEAIESEVSVQEDEGVLRQDRYPLRTSAQWLAPLPPLLRNAHDSITTELNSTTDNPLVDAEGGKIHHGGNFQAMSVTAVMENVRLGLGWMGKLGFTQFTELVNCTMNNGLPSCLAFSNPSTNYHTKGLDIATAAYTSELLHLTNPVSSYVQPAEMGNQAVNSLALISARKTKEANDLLALILSNQAYSVLMALDLRAIQLQFENEFPRLFQSIWTQSFASVSLKSGAESRIARVVFRRLEQTGAMDLDQKWQDATRFITSNIMELLPQSVGSQNISAFSKNLASACASRIRELQQLSLKSRGHDSPTIKYLSPATRKFYLYMRQEMGILMREGDVASGKIGPTIGRDVAAIFECVQRGWSQKGKSQSLASLLVEMMEGKIEAKL